MLLRHIKTPPFRKKNSWILVVLGICVLSVVILRPTFFSNTLLSLLSGVQKAHTTFVHYWKSRQSLSTENVLLKRTCHELRHNLLVLQSQKETLERRATLSPFVTDFSYAFVTCSVIAVDPLHHKALLRGGMKDKVQKGQVVIHPNGYVMGRIESVGKDFSRMIFVSHETFRLPVKGKQSNINGIIHGKNEKTLFLHKESPQPLIQGETLVTSEYGELCPPYIPLGIWSEKDKTVLPFMKKASLEYVYVVLSPIGETDITKMLQSPSLHPLINEPTNKHLKLPTSS